MPPKAKRLTRKEAAVLRDKERVEEEWRKIKRTEEMLEVLGIGKKTQDEELFAGVEKKDWWKIFHAQKTLYEERCKKEEVAVVRHILSSRWAHQSEEIRFFTFFKTNELYCLLGLDYHFIVHWTYQLKYACIAGALFLLPELFHSLFVNEDLFGYYYRGIKAGLNADCKFIYGRQFLKEMDECLTEVTNFFRTKFDVYLEVENGKSGICLKSVGTEDSYKLFLEWLLKLDNLLGRAHRIWLMCEVGSHAVTITERTRQSRLAPHKDVFFDMIRRYTHNLELEFHERLEMLLGDRFFAFAGGRTFIYKMSVKEGEKEGYDTMQLDEQGSVSVDLNHFEKKSLEDPFAKCSFQDLPEFPK